MPSRFRSLTIALVVALLAAATPAQTTVRPAADHRFRDDAILTPMPLDGWTARRAIEEATAAIPLRPAAEEAEAEAAEAGSGSVVPLLVFSGIGALIVLLVTLLVMGQDPRGGRTT